MNSTVFRLEGGHLYFVGSDGNLVGQRTITEKDIKAFSDWAATYENGLIKSVQEAEGTFLALGEAMYQWLDGEEVWMRHLPDFPPLTIEFQVIQSTEASATGFLGAPWELLADKNGHLARNPARLFCPLRRIGRQGQPDELSEYRLGLTFMAASPRETNELDFEAE